MSEKVIYYVGTVGHVSRATVEMLTKYVDENPHVGQIEFDNVFEYEARLPPQELLEYKEFSISKKERTYEPIHKKNGRSKFKRRSR